MAANSMLAAWAACGLWQRSLAHWSRCDVVGCNAALSATERSQVWLPATSWCYLPWCLPKVAEIS